MVSHAAQVFPPLVSVVLFAQQSVPTKEMPPPTRAAALMALLGLALLGLLLVVIILLGGHWVRRIGSHRRGPSVPRDVLVPRRSDSSDNPQVPGAAADGDTFAPHDTRSG